jgi:pimeloyl-ACP methyl ester carboxylesterase
LHVRTAFPTTGGFDEEVTLFCLHASDATSRSFIRLLAELADVRSVYAPDLPGYGESDDSPSRSVEDAAAAISDLASDLRLRQIDLLGIQYGAEVAAALGAARPELVRRLVLLGVPVTDRTPPAPQQRLMIDMKVHGVDPLCDGAQNLSRQISSFLRKS